MVMVTVLFALEIFAYLAIEEFIKEDLTANRVILGIEALLLSVFTADVIINILAFRRHYFHDRVVLIEIIVIFLTLSFVVSDVIVEEKTDFFKIRGVFRILRIFLLFRKVSHGSTHSSFSFLKEKPIDKRSKTKSRCNHANGHPWPW